MCGFPFLSSAQSYHISKYRWGVISPSHVSNEIDWGRFTKADFDIVIDADAGNVKIGGPDETVEYTILDKHPTVIEKYNPSYHERSYCLAADGNSHYEIYIREKDGKAIQVIICDPHLTFWSYQIHH